MQLYIFHGGGVVILAGVFVGRSFCHQLILYCFLITWYMRTFAVAMYHDKFFSTDLGLTPGCIVSF